MIVFQAEPDPVFLAIVHEALEEVRDVQLIRYRRGFRPTRVERLELDESYAALFPELVPFFTRRDLIRVLDALQRASRDTRRWYRLTDYHWLVLYACLQVYCDLHNDGATGTGDKVGPYEIERIDFDAIVAQFFFDTDFLMGPVLLQAEENAPGRLTVTRQAWKIAARLEPDRTDLRLVAVKAGVVAETTSRRTRRWPEQGYIGPYPPRERDAGESED
jgi:hypothetical protein